jgi:cytochrome oxidase assembly protein ShyY1
VVEQFYSRDVMANKGYCEITPFFVDAEAGTSATCPIIGMTMLSLSSKLLVHALTWFA